MRKRNLRIRTTWLCIMLVVILLLCGLFCIYSVSMHRQIRSSEEAANLSNAENIQASLDDTWDTLLNHCLPLVNSTTATRLEDATSYAALQENAVYTLYTDIRNAVTFDPMLSDITVYYPLSDHVVGNLGVKKSRTYWAMTYGLDGQVSYEQWENELYRYGPSGYFLIQGQDSPELYFRHCMGGASDRILLVRIDRKTVAQRLQWVQGDSANSFSAVVTDAGYIYACSGSAREFLDLRTGRINPVDEDHLYTSLPASIEGIRYLTITKKSDVYHLSSSSTTFAMILLVGAVIVSTMLAYWLVRQHVTPWEEMAAKLSKGGHRHYNELDVINTAIDELLKEQDSLSVLSKQQQLVISRAFMTELLQGNPLNKKNPEDIAAAYGISFENARYCIIARKCGSADTEEEVSAWLLSQGDATPVYWQRQGDVDIFLLNFDGSSPVTPQSFRAQLEQISGPEAQVVTGPTVDSPLRIMDCWVSCAQTLGCPNLLPKSYLQKTAQHASPNSSALEQFQQYLATGEFALAQQMTELLFTDYIDDPDAFYFTYKNFRLIHILLPYCPTRLQQSLSLLSQTRSQAQWVQLLGSILAECAGIARRQSQFSDGDVAGKVRSLIDRQYNNPMLDLRMISSQVNLSQSYLSRMFKQKYGTSVAQYINYVRIEKAKELILCGNDSIKAIAIKVGFAGDAQFIRAFKRQEDVTPGSFRSNNS